MVLIDLKDVYLQVSIHPDNREFSSVRCGRNVYNSRSVLRSLLSPPVFIRVMTHDSKVSHVSQPERQDFDVVVF